MVATQNRTNEEVIHDLTIAWTEDNQNRKNAWNTQEQEDEQARQEVERQAIEAEAQLAAQQALELDIERREAEKKRPKLHDFNINSAIGSAIIPRPAAFTINKLENFEYVELWYFTQEGCVDAVENQRVVAENAFRLAKVDDFMALRPVSLFRTSRNVIQDIELSWRQMSMAKNSLLQHMAKAKWPDKHVLALAHFFMNLELHKQRAHTNGERVLLTYQARAQREWHDALKRDEGFNIGTINDTLMRAIADEVWDSI